MDNDHLRDRFRGCLVGQAIGDALGAASEFLTERQVREKFGVLRDYHPTEVFDAGEFTDDTCMALAIAESIIEAESIDSESIADAFVNWMRMDGRGIGVLTRETLKLIEDGMSSAQAGHRAWEKSGKRSAGNGAVMRCAPIALYDWQNSEELVHDCILISQITHYDPRCCWSSVAVSSAIAAMLNNESDPLDAAIQIVRGTNSELERALETAREAEVGLMRLDGEDMGYTILTTGVAFTALREFDSFENGIIAVVNKGGDADTNGAVTGALLGARFGFDALPKRWVEGLINLDRVITAADGLYELTSF